MKSQDQSPSAREVSGLWRFVLPPLLTACAFAAVLLVLRTTGALEVLGDREALREQVRQAGWLAPAAFVLLLAVRPFTFVFSWLFAPVAAELFGVFWGATLKVIGETIGATLAFLVARYGLSRALGGVARRIPMLGRSLDQGFMFRLGSVLARKGFSAVLALRLNLLLPFDGLNYGLGLTTVRIPAYALGTLIGIVPGSFLYVALAGSALDADWPKIALTIGGIVVMVLLSIPLARELVSGGGPNPSSS